MRGNFARIVKALLQTRHVMFLVMFNIINILGLVLKNSFRKEVHYSLNAK